MANVKELLQITTEDYDTELTGCIESSDAVIDSWLTKNDMAMPSPVPKNLEDAAKYFAAWLFRRRRSYDQNTTSFWTEATRFFNAYIEAVRQTEVYEPHFGRA